MNIIDWLQDNIVEIQKKTRKKAELLVLTNEIYTLLLGNAVRLNHPSVVYGGYHFPNNHCSGYTVKAFMGLAVYTFDEFIHKYDFYYMKPDFEGKVIRVGG